MKGTVPNIIIADDHDMFRDALKTMLEVDDIATIIAEASNGQELISLLEESVPDIIIMDIDMPLMNGIEATRIVNEKYPTIKVLALSMYGDDKYYKELIEAGAQGFILKSSNKSELEEAINTIHNGQSYFSNELLMKIIANIGLSKDSIKLDQEKLSFTNREVDVLKYLCLGLSTKDIAERLFLSAKTIENYRVKLLHKTACKNSIGLVVYAIKNGIVEI